MGRKKVDRSVPEDFTSTLASSPPSFYTERDESAPNLMPYMDLIFESIGREPWWSAKMILETQTELTAPLREGGVPVFPECAICGPRQWGKTESVLYPEELCRACLYMTSKKPMKAVMCHLSQNATSTMQALESKFTDIIDSPEFSDIEIKPGSANPRIRFNRTGSLMYIISSNPSAGRSLSPDFLVFDEFQAYTDTTKLGDMEAAIIQQKHARVLKAGTAGDMKSKPWNAYIDTLKKLTANGLNRQRGISFFYWSAEDIAKQCQEEDGEFAEELEWYYRNDDRVLTFHPGLNQPGGAFDIVKFKRKRDNEKELGDEHFNSFKREHLNIELSTSTDQVLNEYMYKACVKQFPSNRVNTKEWVLAVDSEQFSPFVSIALATGDYVRVAAPATPVRGPREYVDKSNFIAAVRSLLDVFPIRKCVSRAGSDLPVMLKEAKIPLSYETLSNPDYALACARLFRSIGLTEINIYPNMALEEAVLNGGSYKLGAGWYWRPILNDINISPLVAVTLAHDVAKKLETRGRPKVRIAGL